MATKTKKTVKDIYPSAFTVLQNIRALSAFYGTTDAELIRAMGGSASTLARRRRCPWQFTTAELTDIARLWGLTPEQLMVQPKYEVMQPIL